MTLQRENNLKIGSVVGLSTSLIYLFLLRNVIAEHTSLAMQLIYFAEFLLAAGLAGVSLSYLLRHYSTSAGVKEMALTGLISGGATSLFFLIIYGITQLLL